MNTSLALPSSTMSTLNSNIFFRYSPIEGTCIEPGVSNYSGRWFSLNFRVCRDAFNNPLKDNQEVSDCIKSAASMQSISQCIEDAEAVLGADNIRHVGCELAGAWHVFKSLLGRLFIASNTVPQTCVSQTLRYPRLP